MPLFLFSFLLSLRFLQIKNCSSFKLESVACKYDNLGEKKRIDAKKNSEDSSCKPIYKKQKRTNFYRITSHLESSIVNLKPQKKITLSITLFK